MAAEICRDRHCRGVAQAGIYIEGAVFKAELALKDCVLYSWYMVIRDKDAHKGQAWSFMQIMFETNTIKELLSHLGIDPE